MVDYTFVNDQGWKITEYRPFSASYAVLHSPSMPDGEFRNTCFRPDSDKTPTDSPVAGNMLATLTNQQLKFNYFSKDVLRQLLEERVTIRNRNRSSILGRLSDLSGEIYGASLLRTPDADKRKQNLEKTRMDLERQLGEEDVTLWRDSLELRRELILADKTYAGTQFRQGLMTSMPSLPPSPGALPLGREEQSYMAPAWLRDDNKGQANSGLSG